AGPLRRSRQADHELGVQPGHARPDHGRAARLPVVDRQGTARIPDLQSAGRRRRDDGRYRVPGGAVLRSRAMLKLYKRFKASIDGVAAIEFAVIAPMLIVVLVESYDIGRAIAAYMKVRAATFTLASVTNQYGIGAYAIATTDMTAITGSAAAVL